MRLLITGICGFVGTALAEALQDHFGSATLEISGIDNLSRAGSWLNRQRLNQRNVRVVHGDIRLASDLEALPPSDWIIDAAANPSVLAGVDGQSSSRQLLEHNLLGTINLLETCKRWRAGLVLLSTSRVYSIPPLAALPVEVRQHAFRPVLAEATDCISSQGITERFSTAPPVSLYGATKLTSEALALEYGHTFDFPVWINRCGVMAGARQFGKPDQGIFAFWLHSWREGRPLKYIGFDGLGHQVRDCLHPRDLAPLLLKQLGVCGTGNAKPHAEHGEHDIASKETPSPTCPPSSPLPSPSSLRIFNLSGGLPSAMSLRQLSDWCADRFPASATPIDPLSFLPKHQVADSPIASRPFDLPWVVLDHSLASATWNWQPTIPVASILEEVAAFADRHPDWIATSA